MNIIQVMRLIGKIPIVEGFWKNMMVGLGLIVTSFVLALIYIGGFSNWITWSILIFSIIVSSLGLYIPSEYFENMRRINRCPNCKNPFSENGEGGIVFRSDSERMDEELEICVCCLSGKSPLDKAVIANDLVKRKWDPRDIKLAMEAIDEFLAGKIPYSIWSDPRKKCS